MQGFANLCMFVIPWIYAPVASKLGIALKGQPASHSSVRRASLRSAWLPSSTGTLPGCLFNAQRNYTNVHNGLFNPCTLIVNELVTNCNQLKQKSCNKTDLSKTSGTLAWFHEVKFAVVARLFEGRSPEFRSHRQMNPWNSKRSRFCEVFLL